MLELVRMNTNDSISELLVRGVEHIYPNPDFLEKLLSGKEKITLYLGIDPTGPTLHLGHAIALRKLSEFQKLGHHIILLLGDFTARIGDPTDKLATRKQLTTEEIEQNMKLYKKQASSWLSFSGDNPARIEFNSKWLGKMTFADVLELSSKMTVQQLIERDMFQLRLREGKPIYVHEFLYPLMQGYDSVAMMVDGEIGGNDQTFNMLVGRELLKDHGKDKFVLTVKLLTDASGKKMGKTEGNMLTLADGAEDMYGKVMSWSDEKIVPGLELCTTVSLARIEEIKKLLEQNENPILFKKELAREIVAVYHDKDSGEQAQQKWESTFSKGEIPEDAKKITVTIKAPLVDLLVEHGFVASKSEFRRLVQEGAITFSGKIEEKKIIDPACLVEESGALRIGKKRFLHIEVKKEKASSD